MAPAAAARQRAGAIYAGYPDDPQLQMIDRYYSAMQERRAALGRARHGQVYTPWEIVQFLVRSALEKIRAHYPADRLRDVRLIDPCCGAGPFLICAAREYAAAARCSVESALRHNIYGADIDLGAAATARAVLRTMAPGVMWPRVMWADTLADFAWLMGDVDIDILDIDAVDRANASFEQAAAAWLRSPVPAALAAVAPAEPGGPMLRPLGVVHVDADARIDLRWRRADGTWLPVPADRPYPPDFAAAA